MSGLNDEERKESNYHDICYEIVERLRMQDPKWEDLTPEYCNTTVLPYKRIYKSVTNFQYKRGSLK